MGRKGGPSIIRHPHQSRLHQNPRRHQHLLLHPTRQNTPFDGLSSHTNKKIKMVITTLWDILQSIIKEEESEGHINDKYVDWCMAQVQASKDDLEEAKTE